VGKHGLGRNTSLPLKCRVEAQNTDVGGRFVGSTKRAKGAAFDSWLRVDQPRRLGEVRNQSPERQFIEIQRGDFSERGAIPVEEELRCVSGRASPGYKIHVTQYI